MSTAVAKPDDLRVLLRKLAPKQRLVLRELPKHQFQFWKAVQACGISSASAHAWMRMPDFRAARTAIEESLLDEIGVTATRILQETAAVAYADPRKLFREDGSPKDMHEIDDQTVAVVASVEYETTDGGNGRVAKIKTRDKLKALEMLGRNRRLWNDDAAKLQAPEGPGLTVIVQQGGAQTAVHAQAGAAGRVVVDLPGPER